MDHSGEARSAGKMGLNWLWYVPLALWVIIDYGVGDAILAYRNVRTILAFPHAWAALFSFSAWAFGFATLLNVWTPVALVLLIPMYFTSGADSEPYAHRYRWTVLSVLGIFAVLLLTAFVIWGSFPFEVDAAGYVHMRMIPFIPWPHRPLVQ